MGENTSIIQKLTDIFTENNAIPREDIPFAPAETERLEKRKWILDYAQKGSLGAEIGVFRGHFSEVLCEVLQPKKLYLVDPWTKLGEDFGWGKDSPYTGYGKLTTDYARRDTVSRVKKFKDIDTYIVEAYADEFLTNLTDKLDWIYLDASHQYGATLNELKLIDTVLKNNGVILGDDWQPARHHKDHGVFRAIHDFVRTYPYEIVAAGPAGQWCLRRSVSSSLESSGLTIEKLNSATISHSVLDKFPSQVTASEPFDIGGVVILTDKASDGMRLQLISARDGLEAGKVNWGIPTPWMAKKYPDAKNSTNSRFTAHGLKIDHGDRLDCYLIDGDGKRELIMRISLAEEK
jgi:SAM-dependent methyltransferase